MLAQVHQQHTGMRKLQLAERTAMPRVAPHRMNLAHMLVQLRRRQLHTAHGAIEYLWRIRMLVAVHSHMPAVRTFTARNRHIAIRTVAIVHQLVTLQSLCRLECPVAHITD